MKRKEGILKWSYHTAYCRPTIISGTVFAYHSDDVITFVDLETGERKMYHASGGEAGDGIACLTGYNFHPVFAFAERKYHPSIYVLLYPSLDKIKVLSTQTISKYVDVRFTDSEFLICLTGYPSFCIVIWNYRKGVVMTEYETGIAAENVKLICGINATICAQYSPVSRELNLWEINPSGEKVFLMKKNEVDFVRAEASVSMTFGLDANLYLIDSDGQLFVVHSSTGTFKKLWTWNDKIESDGSWHIDLYKGGFLIFGSQNKVKFLKKEKTWNVVFEMQIDSAVCWSKSVNNFEKIYFLTSDRKLKQLTESADEQSVKEICSMGPFVKSFALIMPSARYIAVLCEDNSLRIADTFNGDVLTVMQVQNATLFKSFPKLPALLIGSAEGTNTLISCFDPKQPQIMTEFKLNSSQCQNAAITDSFLITFDRSRTFFIIEGKLGGALRVAKHFQVSYDVYKFLAFETNDTLKIYIISICGDELVTELIVVEFAGNQIEEKKYPLKFPIVDAIAYEDRLLVAKFNSNEIYELTLSGDGIAYKVWQRAAHLIKHFEFYSLDNNLMTWGLDGIVGIYDIQMAEIRYAFTAQNRRNQKDFITMGQCTPNQKRCFVLTKRGTLKCFVTSEEIVEVAANAKLDIYFNTPTTSPYQSVSGRSWIENRRYEEQLAETKQHETERAKIMEDFKVVQQKFQLLLDENESIEDEGQRVPLSELNIAVEYTQKIVDKASTNREAEERILLEFIADQNRITTLILNQTWGLMATKSQKIFGLFSHLACENYALPHFDEEHFRVMESKLMVNRKREMSSDIWHPYLPLWQKTLGSKAGQLELKKSTISLSEGSQTGSEADMLRKNEHFALSGTATHHFVDPHPYQYHQIELVSYYQMFVQEFLVEHDLRKLKQHFNEAFEEMMQVKQDTLKYVKARNDRFREIQSEMNALALLRNEEPTYGYHIEDPELAPEETPEAITRVEVDEVKVRPYISKSEQKMLDDMAYSEEQRRLALLADDFRERALVVMMDGVLEKRWEEEIKKDVPKPDVLLKGKEVGEYTRDDYKAIAEYEEKVKQIEAERERYRLMLEEEEKKLQAMQDESILKFNRKCGELFLKKLSYDAAVKHEELKLLRTELFNHQRIKYKQKENAINLSLHAKRQKTDQLTEVYQQVEKKVLEYQQKYEQLQNRDRGLERSFKLQFSESAPAFVVDTAFKLFKRRPKWQQKSWATATIYIELANIIGNKTMSNKSDFPLPDECYEFLNLLDNTDNFAQAPSIIDLKVWEILCRLRRAKIESEFRFKAVGLQLAEAEATLNLFLKEISSTKASIASQEKDLNDLNASYHEFIRNRTVQIVMPKGLVEVPLTGHMTDFSGSLLLSRTDIAGINSIIKKTGEKKLKTMHRLAIFRRKVLMKEWEHKALQMSVQDLKDFLNVIERTNVSFEMRQWLREKSENRVVQITNAFLARKVEAKLVYLNKTLSDIDDQIEECIEKIKRQKMENLQLDRGIKMLNVDVTEKNLNRDIFFEQKQIKEHKERLAICMERSRLIRKVQTGHLQMLELATLLELQKLRTFPTLNPLIKNLCSISNNP